MYLALDPGVTTGWAWFGPDGKFISMGQVHESDLAVFLHKEVPNAKHVIVEDYRIAHNKGRMHAGSRVETIKLIGKIETIAEMQDPPVPVTLQPNNIKALGYKYGGLKGAPANHSISHQYDAVAHGFYYLVRNSIILPLNSKPRPE